jgi:flagellar hook-length control protein FliK
VPLPREDAALSPAIGPGFQATGTSAEVGTVSNSDVGKVFRNVKEAATLSAQTPVSGAEQAQQGGAPRSEAAPPAAASAPADQVHEQISAHLNEARQMGRALVQVDLHPPELGRVQLHLAMEDGHLNVRMIVQDEAVKRLLDMHQEPLRVRFAEMGVSVGQFDVRRDGGSPQQNRHTSSAPSAQPIQTDKNGPTRLRIAYTLLGQRQALVDVIA